MPLIVPPPSQGVSSLPYEEPRWQGRGHIVQRPEVRSTCDCGTCFPNTKVVTNLYEAGLCLFLEDYQVQLVLMYGTSCHVFVVVLESQLAAILRWHEMGATMYSEYVFMVGVSRYFARFDFADSTNFTRNHQFATSTTGTRLWGLLSGVRQTIHVFMYG